MFKKILVPLDGTADAELALEAVKAIDTEFESEVTMLLVSPTESALTATLAEGFGASGSVAAAVERGRTFHDIAEAYLDTIRQSYDASWKSDVRPGEPHRTIVEVADELGTDLIVMASHTRTGISRILMGSVAEDVLRHANRPVLVIPVGHEDDD